MRSKYDSLYHTWKEIPIEVQNMWFDEFKVSYLNIRKKNWLILFCTLTCNYDFGLLLEKIFVRMMSMLMRLGEFLSFLGHQD